MNTKLLKQKILDLAIRGKLVPQDPNDEPASELLKRIRAEKEKLIAEGKIKRSKKAGDKPHYENENAPFEIPESWEWEKLQNIAFVGTGATPKVSNSEYYGGTIPWIGSGATNNDFVITPNLYITEKALRETNCQIYPIGTIVMAMYGEGKTRGQVCELTIECATNQACAAIVPFVFTTKDYIKLFLIGNYYTIRKLSGGGVQPNLNLETIKNYWIPIPPLIEQKRIVSEALKWFALIDEIEIHKQSLGDAIKQTKSKVLDLAFHGKLVSQNSKDEPAIELLRRINPNAAICDTLHYGNLPTNWCTSSLECLCTSIASKKYQIKQSEINKSGKYPVISQSANFIEGYSDVDSKLLHIPSPIIVFGDHTRITKYIDFDFIVGADGVKILQPLIPAKYFYYLTQYVAGKIENRGYSRHYGYLSRCIVPIPPKEELERIALRIEELFNVLDKISADL